MNPSAASYLLIYGRPAYVTAASYLLIYGRPAVSDSLPEGHGSFSDRPFRSGNK